MGTAWERGEEERGGSRGTGHRLGCPQGLCSGNGSGRPGGGEAACLASCLQLQRRPVTEVAHYPFPGHQQVGENSPVCWEPDGTQLHCHGHAGAQRVGSGLPLPSRLPLCSGVQAHRGRLADPRGPCFAELTLLQATPGPEVGRLQEAPTPTSPKLWGYEAGPLLMALSLLSPFGVFFRAQRGEAEQSVPISTQDRFSLCTEPSLFRLTAPSPHHHPTPGLPFPAAGDTPGQPAGLAGAPAL